MLMVRPLILLKTRHSSKIKTALWKGGFFVVNISVKIEYAQTRIGAVFG